MVSFDWVALWFLRIGRNGVISGDIVCFYLFMMVSIEGNGLFAW